MRKALRALVPLIAVASSSVLVLPACSDSATTSDAGDAGSVADAVADAQVADAADASPEAAPGADSGKDATSSCQAMCTQSGFGGSRVDIQPNELNCFCTSGAGEVTDARCTALCTGQGKAKAERFKSTGASFDACQCS